MAVQPLDDRVLIKPLDAAETTSGGIVLPDAAQEKPQRGTVVATGPGKLVDAGKRVPLTLSEGDTVLFGKYAGTEIKIGGIEHQIMRESEVLAVIED